MTDFLPGHDVRELAERRIEGLDGDAAVSALTALLDDLADRHASALAEQASNVSSDFDRERTPFEKRLLDHLGASLELYKLVAVMARDLGDEVNRSFRQQAADSEDYLFGVLVSLHARSCRASLEVLALLSAGYPIGSLSIWRTVYEYAVVARILSRFPDYAKRYLQHEVVQRAADAKQLHLHASTLGIEPLDESEYKALMAEADALVTENGKDFAGDYGWAADLMPKGVRGFRALEQLAGLEHMRPQYRLASHGVHSGARGGALNVFEQGDERLLSVGPQNVGLADPGHGTLLALAQTTAVLVSSAPEDDASFRRAVALKALHLLTDRARGAFLAAETSLEG